PALLLVPARKSSAEPWLPLDPSVISSAYSEQQSAAVMSLVSEMARAYHDADSFKFSSAARQLREQLRALSPSIYPTEWKLKLEYLYNHLELFYQAIWLYGFAFAALLIAHLRKRGRVLRIAGLALAICAIVAQAGGILLRCLIAGRPPVTNMFESIIWVSFAVSFFGMIFFARY